MSGTPPSEEVVMLPAEALAEVLQVFPFPSPSEAIAGGLLAQGGDLRAERVLSAYLQGVFPWYDAPPLMWFSPNPRMVLFLRDLVVNRSLAKNIRRRRFEIRVDTAFRGVIEACAEAPRPEQDGTWIGETMLEGYCRLHELGFAHSVEAYVEERLVGGIYGLALGRAFFGESMFAKQSDASKVAFVTLVRQLAAWGFDFLDCQVHSEHTERFGAREIPREEYLEALGRAVAAPTRRGRWRFSALEGPGLET